jgi:glycosyltransferase involved in cell wall biosynthesis
MPVLEAMSVGTPVVASNASAIPEVTGGAAILVDPYDVSSIAGALETILADGDQRARLSLAGKERAARFVWESTAKETMRVIRRAAGVS